MNTNIKFKPGQCAVYTDTDGTTRSVKIVLVNQNGVRIHWLTSPTAFQQRWLTFCEASTRLVLFPPGEKFMVLEGGAK